MSKRWAWLAGLVVLVLVAFLIACGNTYNPGSNGLVIVGSQGSGLLETFSFSLLAGNNIPIENSPLNTQLQTCVLNGVPTSLVLDPTGTYAYAIINQVASCNNSQNGIQAFKVNQDGTLTTAGSLVPDLNPVALSMDPAGKFLFVMEGISAQNSGNGVAQLSACYQSTELGACSYAIGSGGSLTPVPGTFTFILPPGYQNPYYFASAPTPTVLPPLQNGVATAWCSYPGNNPATTEYLYVADSTNYVVWEFGVDTSTGALTNPPNQTSVPNFTTSGVVPSGIVVEPCNRFVYATNLLSNSVSGFVMCNGLSTAPQTCQAKQDGRLIPVPGSPISVSGSANGPGPLVADPFGHNIYVLDTLSNQVSPFTISTVSGSLQAGPLVTTGLMPVAITIRGDDNWLFVANFNSGTMSQYSIAPANGNLSGYPAITTDNYPYGVAVK